MTGYDPGPATDQWSCDCGQHARRSKACISVRVSSRPKKRSGDRMPQDITLPSFADNVIDMFAPEYEMIMFASKYEMIL